MSYLPLQPPQRRPGSAPRDRHEFLASLLHPSAPRLRLQSPAVRISKPPSISSRCGDSQQLDATLLPPSRRLESTTIARTPLEQVPEHFVLEADRLLGATDDDMEQWCGKDEVQMAFYRQGISKEEILDIRARSRYFDGCAVEFRYARQVLAQISWQADILAALRLEKKCMEENAEEATLSSSSPRATSPLAERRFESRDRAMRMANEKLQNMRSWWADREQELTQKGEKAKQRLVDNVTKKSQQRNYHREMQLRAFAEEQDRKHQEKEANYLRAEQGRYDAEERRQQNLKVRSVGPPAFRAARQLAHLQALRLERMREVQADASVQKVLQKSFSAASLPSSHSCGQAQPSWSTNSRTSSRPASATSGRRPASASAPSVGIATREKYSSRCGLSEDVKEQSSAASTRDGTHESVLSLPDAEVASPSARSAVLAASCVTSSDVKEQLSAASTRDGTQELVLSLPDAEVAVGVSPSARSAVPAASCVTSSVNAEVIHDMAENVSDVTQKPSRQLCSGLRAKHRSLSPCEGSASNEATIAHPSCERRFVFEQEDMTVAFVSAEARSFACLSNSTDLPINIFLSAPFMEGRHRVRFRVDAVGEAGLAVGITRVRDRKMPLEVQSGSWTCFSTDGSCIAFEGDRSTKFHTFTNRWDRQGAEMELAFDMDNGTIVLNSCQTSPVYARNASPSHCEHIREREPVYVGFHASRGSAVSLLC